MRTWNHSCKTVAGCTGARTRCHRLDFHHGSTGPSLLRFLSVVARTLPLSSKILFELPKGEEDCVGGTMIDLLPHGSIVRKGEVIARVEKQPYCIKNYQIPVLAPHPGRISQWYAKPSQDISVGEPILELDSCGEPSLQARNAPPHESKVAETRRLVRAFVHETVTLPFLEMNASEPAKQAVIHYCVGTALRLEKDCQGALEHYLQALPLLHKAYPSRRHTLIMGIHHCIGRCYRHLGNWNQAIKHFRSSLELMIEHNGHSYHPEIAAVYNDLGELYCQMRNYKEAKTYSEVALTICQRMSVPNSKFRANVAGIHHNLGEALRHLNEVELAEQHLQRAVDIRLKLKQDLSTSLFGSCMAFTGSFVASHFALGQTWAETRVPPWEKVQLALSSPELCHETKSLVAAVGYITIGSIHIHKKDFYAALQAYDSALIFLKQMSLDDEYLVEVYNHLGLTSYHLQKYPESLYHYRQSRQILESNHGKDHPILATTIQNIGKTFQALHQYDAAMLEFQTVHTMVKKSLPPDHPDIAKSFSNIGLLLSLQGQHKQALKMHQSAAQINAKTLGKNHPDTASSHFNVGLAWKSQGKLDRAKQEFQKAHKGWIAAHGSDHPDVSIAAREISRL